MNKNQRKIQPKALNRKILKVQLNQKNDIKIVWNFNGMLMPKVFRRHVFITLFDDLQQLDKAEKVSKSCYESFKYGDLYTFASPSTKQLCWYQKTKVQEFHMINTKKQEVRHFYIKKLLLSLINYRQPCFVTFFCHPDQDVSDLEKFLIGFRQKQNFSCMVFIISTQIQENSLNSSNGIFKIKGQQFYLAEFANIYKFYNDHLACIKAQLTFQSLSGDVFIEQNAWRSRTFNTINRKIYYPLSVNFTDIFETQMLATQIQSQWIFKIKFNYKLLNSQCYYSEKQLRINLLPDLAKYVTQCHNTKNSKKYELFFGIQLNQNPFQQNIKILSGI